MKHSVVSLVGLFLVVFAVVGTTAIQPCRAGGYDNLVARVAQANARERKVFEKVAKTFDLYALYNLSLAIYKMIVNAKEPPPQATPAPPRGRPAQPLSTI